MFLLKVSLGAVDLRKDLLLAQLEVPLPLALKQPGYYDADDGESGGHYPEQVRKSVMVEGMGVPADL